MSTIKSRLDQIEDALAPKEAVIAWLEEMHGFESIEKYGDWLAELPDDRHPLSLLLFRLMGPLKGVSRNLAKMRIRRKSERAFIER
jgi:hypothetical protein